MNRQEKQLIIDSLKSDFAKSKASFLVGVHGMTVDQIQALRKSIRKEGGSMKVAKNTLVKIAAQGVPGVQELESQFKDQVALVFPFDKVTSIAKILSDFSKEHEKLQIVAGCLDEKVIDKNKVNYLASLPSKEVLMAQLCGILKSPLVRIAWIMKQVAEKPQ